MTLFEFDGGNFIVADDRSWRGDDGLRFEVDPNTTLPRIQVAALVDVLSAWLDLNAPGARPWS